MSLAKRKFSADEASTAALAHENALLSAKLVEKTNEANQLRALLAEHEALTHEQAAVQPTLFVDPVLNLHVSTLRDALDKATAATHEARNVIEAQRFNPQEALGKQLVNRVRVLQLENEELGRQLADGKLAAAEAELAAQKDKTAKLEALHHETLQYLIKFEAELDTMAAEVERLGNELKRRA